MANTYHQVLIQAVFAVKYRNAVIDKKWKNQLHSVMGQLILNCKCQPIIVNGVEDHVHCFLGLKPTISISKLMQKVKGASSHWLNQSGLIDRRFEWQRGYGVFSYNRASLDSVYKYIQNQEAHHAKQSFKKEYTALLEQFEVEYEEEYIFEDLI